MAECYTPDGVVGSCIHLTDCSTLVNLLAVPSPSILNYLRQSICGYEGFDPKVQIKSLNDQQVDTLLEQLTNAIGVLLVLYGSGSREHDSVLFRRTGT